MNVRCSLLAIILLSGIHTHAQNIIRLKAYAAYRLFGGNAASLYDTSNIYYSSSRSYNTVGKFWEYDSVATRQVTPIDTTTERWFQTYYNDGRLKTWVSWKKTKQNFYAEKDSFGYDNSGNINLAQSFISSDYTLVNWTVQKMIEYHYSANHLDSSVMKYNYQGNWYTIGRTINTYAGGALIEQERYYPEYVVVGQWYPDILVRSEFDVNGRLLNDTTFKLINNLWSYSNSSIYQYDPSGNMIHCSRKGPQNINANFFLLASETQYIYDNNHNMIQEVTSALYQDMVWRNYTRRSWTYNNNNFPDNYKQESWDDNIQQWKIQQWGSNMITLKPDELITYYYENTTDIADVFNGSDFSIFPNPASTTATIHFSTPLSSAMKLQVLDLNGRLISLQSVPGNVTEFVIKTDFVPGVYMLHLSSEKQHIVHPLLVQ